MVWNWVIHLHGEWFLAFYSNTGCIVIFWWVASKGFPTYFWFLLLSFILKDQFHFCFALCQGTSYGLRIVSWKLPLRVRYVFGVKFASVQVMVACIFSSAIPTQRVLVTPNFGCFADLRFCCCGYQLHFLCSLCSCKCSLPYFYGKCLC